MRTLFALVALVPLAACKEAPQTATYPPSPETSERAAMSDDTDDTDAQAAQILEGLTFTRLDGERIDLAEAYAGKTLLIVNTASACGLTPQYAGLESLYKEKSGQGLVVLGFPANDFMGQEPLANDEIAAFCSDEYSVTFPVFEKSHVKGEGVNPLFARLNEATGEPSWNFTKYLVTPRGTITRYDPRTTPDDPDLRSAIENALAER